MATASTNPQYIDPIAGLTSILDLYNGKTSTSTSSPETTTETTKSNLTDDQLQAAITSAMAPLNSDSHAVGLSTYSDTSLALGRAQVAADVAAKNAGTTRTTTSSGKTVTNATPGALSPSNIGGTLGALAVTQIGAPLVKKLGTSGLVTGAGDYVSGALDSIMSPSVSNSWGGENSVVRDALSSAGEAGSASLDALQSGVGSLATSAGSTGILSDVGDAISNGASNLWDSLSNFFKDGGMVQKKPGYADGGTVDTTSKNQQYIDRFAPIYSVAKGWETDPSLTASGQYNSPQLDTQDSLMQAIADVAKTQGSGDGTAGQNGSGGIGSGATSDANKGYYTRDAVQGFLTSGKYGLPSALTAAIKSALSGGINTGELLAKVNDPNNGFSDPIAALSAIQGWQDSGVPTVAQSAAADSSQTIGANQPANPMSLDPSQRTIGGNSGLGSSGPGGSSGDPDARAAGDTAAGGYGGAPGEGPSLATGGSIKGPGTGTSDSIDAKLSNGERVITAKTVAGVEKDYPDLFAILEQRYNPAAAMAQAAMGRN